MSATEQPPATCRACGAASLEAVLDLGEQPAAATFPTADELVTPEPMWPLRMLVCGTCWLVQLDEGPDEGTGGMPIVTWTGTMRRHAQAYAQEVHRRLEPGATRGAAEDWRVVETASHGNYLQPLFRDLGIGTLIAEGSDEWAAAASATGLLVEPVRVAPGAARGLERRLGGPADALVDYYLLAHLRDPVGFLTGVAEIIGPRGLAAIEFDHLLPVIEERQFDAVRHGHFSYLSFTAFETALERAGLAAFDVERLEIYGGAVRAWVQSASAGTRQTSSAVAELRAVEERTGLRDIETYRRYRRSVDQTRSALREFLEDARRDGHSVAGYGAPSRGNTLLNSCRIGSQLLPYTVDRSPAKHGHVLPGSHIPIYAPARLAETKPDFVLVLTWDLVDEVQAQLPEVRTWGGRFVVPIPEVRVLT